MVRCRAISDGEKGAQEAAEAHAAQLDEHMRAVGAAEAAVAALLASAAAAVAEREVCLVLMCALMAFSVMIVSFLMS